MYINIVRSDKRAISNHCCSWPDNGQLEAVSVGIILTVSPKFRSTRRQVLCYILGVSCWTRAGHSILMPYQLLPPHMCIILANDGAHLIK